MYFEGLVIAATDEGVIAVRASDGSVAWRTPVGEVKGDIALANGRVIASGGTSIVSINASDGAIVWQSHIEWGHLGATVARDGVIISAREGVVALRESDGSFLWSWNDTAPSGIEALAGTRASPFIQNGSVYLTLVSGMVNRLDSGREIWRTNLSSPEGAHSGAGSAPFILGGLLIVNGVGDPRFDLTALDPLTGEVRWRGQPRNPDFSGAASADNETIFVGCSDVKEMSFICAHDAQSGRLLWKSQGSPSHATASWIVVRGGRLFVTEEFSQEFEAFDAASGERLLSKDLGPFARALGAPLVLGDTVILRVEVPSDLKLGESARADELRAFAVQLRGGPVAQWDLTLFEWILIVALAIGGGIAAFMLPRRTKREKKWPPSGR